MRDYVILNPQGSSQALEAHLRAINLHQLKPDLATLEHGGEMGQEMIPNSFPPEDKGPTTHPLEGAKGVDLEGVEVADP